MRAMGALSTWSELDPDDLVHLRRAGAGDDDGDRDDGEEAPVIGYLRGGHLFLPLMEATTDVLGRAFTVDGGSSLLTDGEWVWRLDLATYVERYHLELPAAFVEHARAHGFTPPDVPDAGLARIEREIVALGPEWYRP